jgi:hypothetical protein
MLIVIVSGDTHGGTIAPPPERPPATRRRVGDLMVALPG